MFRPECARLSAKSQAGIAHKLERCTGGGLPSLALGPGIHAGTTESAVGCLVCHSGWDAGIQGRVGVIGHTWAVSWLRVTVRGTGSRHPCRDDGHRGWLLGPSFRLGCRNPGPGRGDRSNASMVLQQFQIWVAAANSVSAARPMVDALRLSTLRNRLRCRVDKARRSVSGTRHGGRARRIHQRSRGAAQIWNCWPRGEAGTRTGELG